MTWPKLAKYMYMNNTHIHIFIILLRQNMPRPSLWLLVRRLWRGFRWLSPFIIGGIPAAMVKDGEGIKTILTITNHQQPLSLQSSESNMLRDASRFVQQQRTRADSASHRVDKLAWQMVSSPGNHLPKDPKVIKRCPTITRSQRLRMEFGTSKAIAAIGQQ